MYIDQQLSVYLQVPAAVYLIVLMIACDRVINNYIGLAGINDSQYAAFKWYRYD